MQPFDFRNPTRVICAPGAIPRVGGLLAEHGQRALLVSGGGSIARNGVRDQVLASCAAAGVTLVMGEGVQPNPLLSKARALIAQAKAENVTVILAVGGGSVLDTAKAVAGGAATGVDPWDVLEGRATFASALPLVTINTLPATGSEMNGGWVLTHDQTREKLGNSSAALFPRASIWDPTVLRSLPPAQIAYGAVDATAHLLEGYATCADPRTPLQDRYAEGVFATLIEAADAVRKDQGDLDAGATFMWATSLAWNGLALAGLGAVGFPNHAIEHPLSAIHDLAHGAGLALVIPAWMEWAADRHTCRLARFARVVHGVQAADDRAAVLAGATAFRAWCTRIGAPCSWRGAGVTTPDLDLLARHGSSLCGRWGMTDYTPAVVRTILDRIPRD